jgi:assimilatory nitrate reductase catalytic subunit
VAARYTPQVASEITGVPAEKIVQAALLYGRARTSMLMHARGIEHHTNGVNNVLSYINLVLATGQIGRPGQRLRHDHRTGATVRAGANTARKADQLPGQRSMMNPEHRKHVCEVWGLPEEELPQAGVSVVEMFGKMREGEIRGLLSICNNVMVSLPDTNQVRRSLEGLDFYVCIDFFMSEGARYADVVLPGTTWSEDEGVTTNSEGRVVKINKAADPPGEAREDWWIVQEIARRMGREKYFGFNSRARFSTNCASPRAAATPTITASLTRRSSGRTASSGRARRRSIPGTPRLFEKRFTTRRAKRKFHPVEYNPPAEVPDEEYPLILTSGRVVYQYLSGNQTRRIGLPRRTVPGALRRNSPGDGDAFAGQRRRARQSRLASRRGHLPRARRPHDPPRHDLHPLPLGRRTRGESTDQPGARPHVEDTGVSKRAPRASRRFIRASCRSWASGARACRAARLDERSFQFSVFSFQFSDAVIAPPLFNLKCKNYLWLIPEN